MESSEGEALMLMVHASAGRSRIHGKGLIAREAIPAGTLIWALRPGFDVEMTKQQFEELARHSREQVARYIYTDVVTGNYILCSDDAKYMNHSDTPNTRTEGRETVAISQIEPGQEITCNYYEFDGATRKTTVQE
jgi:SET domain-containing protein